MRIRDLLQAFRANRARELSRSDTVSFEAFCNDSPEKFSGGVKESSLMGDYSSSPAKVKISGGVSERRPSSSCCPNLSTILLVIVLTAVFIVLPLAYLLNCFDLIYKHNAISYLSVKEKSHYEPSSKVHDKLKYATVINDYKPLKDLPFPPKPDYTKCKLVKDPEKFDCHPETGGTPEKCEARGCCWIPAKDKPKNLNDLNTPYCFYPPNFNRYNYINYTETAFGLVAILQRKYRTAYPQDISPIKLVVKFETENRLHIQIQDSKSARFEPQYPEVPVVDQAADSNLLKYVFRLNITDSGFQIIRRSDQTIIFDACNFNNLIFSDQFLQISSKLPSKFIYGLGEHQSRLLLDVNWSQFTLFNHDAIPSFGKNLYGSQPFYLVMEPSGNSHGVYLHNSNAMDIILQPTPAITFRPIGGILDLYYFLGPSPQDVVSQYTDLVGRPFMPPYWALGFHLCRFGYKTLDETKKVMQRNIDAGIPLDTQWNDLDYMNNSNDFTYDHSKFKGLPEFVKDLHARGMHYIPLVDPGVSASEPDGSYPPFDEGVKLDIFVKNSTGHLFIGKVWNRESTVWPDFTHPQTVDYWAKMLGNLHEKIPFDGAWIDMNEPSNFLSGTTNGCPKVSLENPPYLPGVDGGVLYYKTMCMSAKHFGGLHYDVHNCFGLAEAIVTNFALAEIRGKRPVVISRATFAGQGHYSGHWSGDVVSAWTDMEYSIPQLLSFSLFGVPLMGADICGFNGNTTASLCNRWMQLGAFYPFSRNHNTDDGLDQDPAALGDLVIKSSKKALEIRYSFLPYLYTLFWRAHVDGLTVSRPLFFEYPNDLGTYNIDKQFLWGAGLMIVPVLQENEVTVNVYLPEDVWYDFYSKSGVQSPGKFYNWSAPLDTIPLFLRGGYIFPRQSPANTTTQARLSKVQLLITLDLKGSSEGELLWDDGDSLNTFEEKRYTLFKFSLQQKLLRCQIANLGPILPPNLGSILVLGVNSPVKEVLIGKNSTQFTYDSVHKFLFVDQLDLSLNNDMQMSWI